MSRPVAVFSRLMAVFDRLMTVFNRLMTMLYTWYIIQTAGRHLPN